MKRLYVKNFHKSTCRGCGKKNMIVGTPFGYICECGVAATGCEMASLPDGTMFIYDEVPA